MIYKEIKIGLFLVLVISSLSSTEAKTDSLNFKYWPYELEGCNNTKDQFLSKTSSITKVTKTKKHRKNCNVATGRWKDFFTGELIKNGDDLIVAPIIPLAHIKYLKTKWPTQRTFSYVHDQDILITFKKNSDSEKAYRANYKGINTIPDNDGYKCEFLGMWMDTKIKWGIPFMRGEKQDVSEAALDCLKKQNYNRVKIFGPWTKIHGRKCLTRTEVLRRDSLNKPSRGSGYGNDKCTSNLRGVWHDPYTNTKYSSTKELDIDHVVPLKHAYVVGAWSWPKWKKVKYANYMNDPFHLLAVDFSENRRKGNKHPGKYLPPNEDYQCEYIENWINIKFRWGLEFTEDESIFLISATKRCSNLKKKNYQAIIDLLRNTNLITSEI